ncbi:putative flavin carrier protein 3 [Metarhizium acridum]|uniref:putative flavin carrier protein 3 n=1 Tax=Metarhizium acridum TaxID=92637 RepID=UPI001C6C6078|nr:putative flavin carrier protein 3 [Metarhizium acridum]
MLRKNPDARYRIMADDRASFTKSDIQLANVKGLDALEPTAQDDKSRSSLQLGQKRSQSPIAPFAPLLPASGGRLLN